MKRMVSGLMSVAFVACIGTSALAEGKMGSMGMMGKCGRHYHWVKGYTTKHGKHVKGYCAKDRR